MSVTTALFTTEWTTKHYLNTRELNHRLLMAVLFNITPREFAVFVIIKRKMDFIDVY